MHAILRLLYKPPGETGVLGTYQRCAGARRDELERGGALRRVETAHHLPEPHDGRVVRVVAPRVVGVRLPVVDLVRCRV